MLGAILSLIVSGLIIGLLARFAVPGKDPLKLWQTILLGISGSFLGTSSPACSVFSTATTRSDGRGQLVRCSRSAARSCC